MKKVLLISTLILSTFLGMSSFAKSSAQSLDQIVAVVNDDVITKSELDHAINTVKMQMSQQNISAPDRATMQKKVLDQLINKRLQLQLAKHAGIQIKDSDLDAAIQRIASQNNIPVSELYQHVNESGMSTAEYRSELRDQITLQKVQQQELAGKITVSPQELNSYIHSHAWQMQSAKEYHLEDVLIPTSDTPSSQELLTAKKHANDILNKLNQGQTIQTVTKADVGSGKLAAQGGDLGWRKLSDIPSAFAEAVSHMKAHEILGPIQTSNGFHILHLDDVRNTATHENAPDKKQIEEMLLQQKFEDAVKNWTSKLRSQAFIINNLENKKG